MTPTKKISKKVNRKKAVRSITAPVKDRIRALVDILYNFLPMTYAPITFYSIFKESRIEHYLNSKESNKRKKLQEGFTKLFRYHKNLPYTIIRKIVPAAIDFRNNKRKPLKSEEIQSLISILLELNIDMEKELSEITLKEELPKIQVPPDELIRRLDNHPLVDEIASDPLDLFKNGHFNESVRKSSERFEVKVQSISGSTEIGKALMSRVFNTQNPIIKLNNLSTENERGIQEGYMYMTMGLIRAIRNIFSHGDEDTREPEECYEMLLYINWLFRQLPS